jgi:hypothetical protein
MKSVSSGHGGDAAPRKATISPVYTPVPTIKCDGPAAFRSQQARDFACLLDVDPDVERWSATPPILRSGNDEYQVDFQVVTYGGSFLVDVAHDAPVPPDWLSAAVSDLGHRYRAVAMAEFAEGYRLRNAKDLLLYGFYRASLGDRVRILAALDEMGSLTVAESLSAVREGRPMATLASLILQGFLAVDLDAALIGPETAVRRIRD